MSETAAKSDPRADMLRITRELATLECAHRHAEADRAAAMVLRGVGVVVIFGAGTGLLFANAIVGSILLWIALGVIGVLVTVAELAAANSANSRAQGTEAGIIERRVWLAEFGK